VKSKRKVTAKQQAQIDKTITSLVEHARPQAERLTTLKAVEVQPEFMGVLEAEILSGISRWTWRQMAYQRRITSCKVGRRLLLPVSEVRRVITEGTRERISNDRAAIVRLPGAESQTHA